MSWGMGRRLAFAGAFVAAFGLAAGAAGAHSFGKWSGKKGPFAWHSKRVSCGSVGTAPSQIRAHTRWRRSPANGYARLKFVRQVKNDAGRWVTVQKPRRSTKNTNLEGSPFVLHWSQRLNPFAADAGRRSRHVVVFEFVRDRPGRDRVLLKRTRVHGACTVGG